MTESDNTTPFAAKAYDRLVRQTIPFYEEIQTETLDVVRTLKPGVECWLDTGCGTGYLISLALPFFPKTRFVLADPSEAMLSEAVTRFRDEPEPRVSFLPNTSTEGLLECKSKLKPQVITAVLSHHYLSRQQRSAATRACYELLDVGGAYITVENICPSTPKGLEVGMDRWKRYQTGHGRELPAVEKHLKRFNSSYFPITVNDHMELLKQTGFQTVEIFWAAYTQAGFYAIK